MAGIKIFGEFYINPAFLDFINHLYYPARRMIASVEKIKNAKGEAFLDKMKWGDYQPLLIPTNKWPLKSGSVWAASTKYARDDLTKQKNYDPVSRDDPRVPANRCALLDATVRKCFTTTIRRQKKPGIPMMIDVKLKSPDDLSRDVHDVQLSWTYVRGSDTPIQLNLTMLCPNKAGALRTRAASKAKK